MDGYRFDQMVRELLAGETRRHLLGRFATLPLAAALAVLLEEESEAKGRRQRRKAPSPRQAQEEPQG